jgi:cytochrome c oxidase cbb3-type subunit 3
MGRGQPPTLTALIRETALALAAVALLAGGCEVEARHLGPARPASPPNGPADPRARGYETNRYEQGEGARLFRWSGCDACHTDPSPGYLNLADTDWRRGGSTVDIYRAIAQGAPGMPAYADRLTPQQTWQVAGYVGGLNRIRPGQRRRNANGQAGEPSGAQWTGPLS